MHGASGGSGRAPRRMDGGARPIPLGECVAVGGDVEVAVFAVDDTLDAPAIAGIVSDPPPVTAVFVVAELLQRPRELRLQLTLDLLIARDLARPALRFDVRDQLAESIDRGDGPDLCVWIAGVTACECSCVSFQLAVQRGQKR
jgi:hypothetical protein